MKTGVGGVMVAIVSCPNAFAFLGVGWGCWQGSSSNWQKAQKPRTNPGAKRANATPSTPAILTLSLKQMWLFRRVVRNPTVGVVEKKRLFVKSFLSRKQSKRENREEETAQLWQAHGFPQIRNSPGQWKQPEVP